MRDRFHIILTICALCMASSLAAARELTLVDDDKPRVRPFILDSIAISRADVFDSTTIPIIGGVLDHLHALTKERVIREEIFREIGDTVTQSDLDEIEQNLRGLTIFADLRIDVRTTAEEEMKEVPHATLYIWTQDSWSLRTAGSYSTNDTIISYSGSLREANLLGYGKTFGLSADYTNFNNRGWRYGTFYLNPNIFGTYVQVGGEAILSGPERSGYFFAARPFFSDRTPYAFSALASYAFGPELSWLRRSRTEVVTSEVPAHRTTLSGWFSSAKQQASSSDVFRSSVSILYNQVRRDDGVAFPRAFENSVGVFGGISSRRREYTRVVGADMDGDVQVPVGAMGSVTVGKIAPVNGGGDNVVYIGADARQSVRWDNFVGSAAVESGTGLSGKSAQFTTFRSSLKGTYLFNPGALVMRISQSTVWNWPRYLALPIDNLNGLRGYSQGTIFGDNRIVINTDLRFPSLLKIWIFDLGAAAFYDLGSVWRQSEQIGGIQFHSSAGLGIRVGNARASIDKGWFRVDIPYNFDERRISRIIISSQEAFDFFGTLDYRPPAPYLY
ncbi:MAG: hypothetical protein ABIR47_09765 [Candidatus Kapaibacterium sp.]